jgi:putative ABC transport system permease protein
VRYPGLTIVGGLAMAFAIAIGAAAFEAILQVARPRLPYPDSERIVAIRHWDMAANRIRPTTARDLLAWREQLSTVPDLGAFREIPCNLITEQGHSGPIRVAEISASAFRISSVAPVIGRVLVDADEGEGAPAVIVIGHDVWQTHFNGDRAAIGQRVRLGRSEAVVVGVMPEGFAFPLGQNAWTPLRLRSSDTADAGPVVDVFGRLAPGLSLLQGQAELSALGVRAAASTPETHEHLRPLLSGYAEAHTPIGCTTMSWSRCMSMLRAGMYSSNLFFVVFLVLVCANVALLMFARAAARENEIIVRHALGASRGRIITQLVAEALVLGGVAALIGLPAAALALRITLHVLDHLGSYPFWWQPTLSLPSVAYTVVLTMLGATVAGVLPALKVTYGDRLRQVTAGAGGLQFGGVWSTVIVLQIALTVVFVASAAYFTHLMAVAGGASLGFPAHEYLSVRMDGPISPALLQEFERRVSADARVTGVTFASQLPGHDPGARLIQVDGRAGSSWVQTVAIAADFFATLGVPIRLGREFHAAADRSAIIVNEPFVQLLLGGRNALGRQVRFCLDGRTEDTCEDWHDIVGVVQPPVVSLDPGLGQAAIYVPLTGGRSSVYTAVHVRGDPQSFAPRLRALVTAIEPALRLYELRPLDGIRGETLRYGRMWLWILALSSLLVLGLSLAGIYSIMSFTVSRRTREIGIRVALGAERGRLLLAIFARPLARFGAGVLIGMGLIAIMMKDMVSVRTVAVALVFTMIMMGVCLLACIVPTRRALSIQPTEALRADG